jgi:Uma2 family endonuclease
MTLTTEDLRSLTTPRPMTFEDYLLYDDGSDKRYELVDGVLVEMGAESPLNIDIGSFLFAMFLQFVPSYLIHKGTEIETPQGSATSRYPDLMVLTEACAAALVGKKRSIITADMPSPAIVIEVVSPGDEDSKNYERDYESKPREYADRGIPEYWIVDPDRAWVRVLVLQGGTYQVTEFRGSQSIVSPTFPALRLTAIQVLTGGRV